MDTIGLGIFKTADGDYLRQGDSYGRRLGAGPIQPVPTLTVTPNMQVQDLIGEGYGAAPIYYSFPNMTAFLAFLNSDPTAADRLKNDPQWATETAALNAEITTFMNSIKGA